MRAFGSFLALSILAFPALFLSPVPARAVSPAAAGESATVALNSGVDPAVAAASLRAAVAAFEEAARRPLPELWTRGVVERGKTLTLGPGLFLLLMDPSEQGLARLMFVDDQGPHEVAIGNGQEATLGAARVILLFRSSDGKRAEVLFRAAETTPFLSPGGDARPANPGDEAPGEPATRVTALSQPNRIGVESPSPRTVSFAVAFLDGLNAGQTAENAARTARALVPPHGGSAVAGLAGASNPSSLPEPPTGPAAAATPARNAVQPQAADTDTANAPMSNAALVTLNLVRGDSGTLSTLSTQGAYRSDGAQDANPDVRASSDARGGTVSVGHPGDRFNAQLQALEASRQVKVESRMFVRVQLGGRSLLSMNGPTGTATAWVRARPRGRSAVELEIDQTGGDWSFLGSVSTSVTVRDGQTILLAQNTTQRSADLSSGVPIARDIPFVGPLFRREFHTTDSSTYALYATVDLE